MTNMKRITISVPVDMENAIYKLRNKPGYQRSSKSDIVRKLVEIGLKVEAKKRSQKGVR